MGEIALEILTGSWNLTKMGFSSVGSFLSKLNAQGVAGLVVSLVLALLLAHEWGQQRHWKKQDARDLASYNAELAHEAKIAKQATDLKASIDSLTINISTLLKEENDAEIDRINGSADALRMRGPGKAVCARDPQPAPAAGGPQSSGRPGDAPVAQLPDAAGIDIIGLPFDDTISFGADHDKDRAEVLTWREWYNKLVHAWPKGAIQP